VVADLVPIQVAADSSTGFTTIGDLLALLPAPDYAEIYVTGGTAAQTLSTAPALLTAFTTDGLANGATPAHGTDSVTVAATGVYEVCVGTSMYGDNGAVILVEVYVDAAATQVGTKRTMSAASAVGSATRCGLVSLTAAEVVTAQVSASAATPDIVVERGALSIVQIR
jgi:hypothetical protein